MIIIIMINLLYFVDAEYRVLCSDSVRTRRSCGFESRQRQEIFVRNVQTGSGSHSISHSVGTADLSQGMKRPGFEVNHSPPTIAEFKNEWSCNFTPPWRGESLLFVALGEILVWNS